MDVREKLVELIESARSWGSGTSEEIADHLIDNGVTAQEWISVDDELPEVGGYVVCIAKKKSIFQIYANGSKNREKWLGKSNN